MIELAALWTVDQGLLLFTFISCTHTYTHSRHTVHPHINLWAAPSPGGLASLLTVVVYTYKRSETPVCTCIQRLKPPTPTCWKWSVAQSETRAPLSEIHGTQTRARRFTLMWTRSGWEFASGKKPLKTNKGLCGCSHQFNVRPLLLVSVMNSWALP